MEDSNRHIKAPAMPDSLFWALILITLAWIMYIILWMGLPATTGSLFMVIFELLFAIVVIFLGMYAVIRHRGRPQTTGAIIIIAAWLNILALLLGPVLWS